MSYSIGATAAPRRAWTPLSLHAVAVGHVGLSLFTLVFVTAALVLSSFVDYKFNVTMTGLLSGMLAMMVVIYLMLALVVGFVRMAVVVRPENPGRYFAGAAYRNFLAPERLAQSTACILLVTLFTSAFAYLKGLIPILNPFGWDQALARLDRAIFLGVDPWKLTFALFGGPTATTAINAIYNGWFFVIYIATLSAAFGYSQGKDRLQFLYAFFLIWAVGGVLFATIFSSAGPVYYARLGLGMDFEPQMELLRQFSLVSPVWALDVQDMLWQSYSSSGDGAISGISAFPSLHVGSSVVVTLYAFRLNRWLGYAVTAFSGVILVGSVHLAWHYAVDGLFSVGLAVLCWKLAGRLARLDLNWQSRVLGPQADSRLA